MDQNDQPQQQHTAWGPAEGFYLLPHHQMYGTTGHTQTLQDQLQAAPQQGHVVLAGRPLVDPGEHHHQPLNVPVIATMPVASMPMSGGIDGSHHQNHFYYHGGSANYPHVIPPHMLSDDSNPTNSPLRVPTDLPPVTAPQGSARTAAVGRGGTANVTVDSHEDAGLIRSGDDRPTSSHSANTSAGGLGSEGSPAPAGSGGTPGSAGGKSRYRGVSYDRKKAKWRVQIKVAALGKSGVSVGYFDTEEAAARAYDRAAIGLLGQANPNLQTNYPADDYAEEPIPQLTGKSREEVKTTLKSERIKQAPRRRFTSRQRTSRFMGVGSSNRKNQWQARILVHGKVTHLGYYETEEDAARVYDRVSLALHGGGAQTNFPSTEYDDCDVAPYRGLDREDLQRALGVKPMDKSSRFRGVSKKKGKWEAKVMVNRRWAYRELFDSEEEAARAYDRALWRLKPREARSYVNFKDEVPPEVEAWAAAAATAPGGTAGGRSPHADLVGFDDGGMSDGGGGLASYDEAEFSDDGEFQYEYRPTKGTARSEKMRAKRSGSAPNLAALATVAAASNTKGNGRPAAGARSSRQPVHQQEQEALNGVDATAAMQQRMPVPASADVGPLFVALPGGGLQLQFGSGGVPPGMVPMPQPDATNNADNNGNNNDEPLLIRVGSETHFLTQAAPYSARTTLGKRTGLQRIQSEPQFSVAATTSSPLDVPGDISELIHDRDLFKGLNLDMHELLGGAEEPAGGHAGSHLDASHVHGSHNHHLDFPSLAEMMQTDGGGDLNGVGMTRDHHRGGDSSSLFFEDEELLANLEFTRPRKMSKSMSMSQLSSLAASSPQEAALPPLPGGFLNKQQERVPGHDAGQGGGKPPLAPASRSSPPPPAQLGALGQPIRRNNTFTTSLATFEEGEEKALGMHHQHSSEDDLGRQLLDQAGDKHAMLGLDDPLHL